MEIILCFLVRIIACEALRGQTFGKALQNAAHFAAVVLLGRPQPAADTGLLAQGDAHTGAAVRPALHHKGTTVHLRCTPGYCQAQARTPGHRDGGKGMAGAVKNAVELLGVNALAVVADGEKDPVPVIVQTDRDPPSAWRMQLDTRLNSSWQIS